MHTQTLTRLRLLPCSVLWVIRIVMIFTMKKSCLATLTL